MTSPDRTNRVLLAASCLGVALLAFWQRAALVGAAPTSEEVSDIYHRGVGQMFFDSEIGVNPPLLRLVLNGLFECHPTLVAGRWLSVICGALTAPVVLLLASRLCGGRLAGPVVAALVVAAHPIAVGTGAEFRAYAPLLLALSAHLLALLDALDAPVRSRAHVAAVLVTGALVAQLHYLGLATVLALGASLVLSTTWRSLAWTHAASAATMLPVVALAVSRTQSYRPESGALGALMVRMLSLELHAPWWVLEPWDRFMPSAIPGSEYDRVPSSVLFVLLVLTVGVLSVRARDVRRLPVWSAWLGVLAAMAVLGLQHRVRSPAVNLVLVPSALFMAWAVDALPRAWLRGVAAVGAALVLRSAFFTWADHRVLDASGAGAVALAHDWRTLDEARDGGTLHVYPAGGVVAVWFTLTGHAWDMTDGSDRCDERTPCFVRDGVTFRGISTHASNTPTLPSGLVVAVDRPPDGLFDGCVRVEGASVEAYRCP